jgi:hypothetical protein
MEGGQPDPAGGPIGSLRALLRAGGGGGSEPPPRYLRVGGKYDPSEVREKTRRQLALILAALLAIIALCLLTFVATNLLTDGEAKDLAAAVLSPIVAVTGTALGFYFGGQRNGS